MGLGQHEVHQDVLLANQHSDATPPKFTILALCATCLHSPVGSVMSSQCMDATVAELRTR